MTLGVARPGIHAHLRRGRERERSTTGSGPRPLSIRDVCESAPLEGAQLFPFNYNVGDKATVLGLTRLTSSPRLGCFGSPPPPSTALAVFAHGKHRAERTGAKENPGLGSAVDPRKEFSVCRHLSRNGHKGGASPAPSPRATNRVYPDTARSLHPELSLTRSCRQTTGGGSLVCVCV